MSDATHVSETLDNDGALPTRMRSSALHAATTMAWIHSEANPTHVGTAYVYAAEITYFLGMATGSPMYFASTCHRCTERDFLTRYAERYGSSDTIHVLNIRIVSTVTVAR